MKRKVFIPNFYIYPKRNILFECIPINFYFSVHSQLKKLCPKSHKIYYFFSEKIYHKQIDIHAGAQVNRISVAPFLRVKLRLKQMFM